VRGALPVPATGVGMKPGLARAGAVDLAAMGGPLLAELAAIEGRRLEVVVTLVADHLYLEVNGRALDGPLHRVAG